MTRLFTYDVLVQLAFFFNLPHPSPPTPSILFTAVLKTLSSPPVSFLISPSM